MNVLIVFGSKSDAEIYNPIAKSLEEAGFEIDLNIISAHRNHEKLASKLSENKFDFIVAGAGLAAHLPGVVASQTLKPVFGVPVSNQFNGIDALCSIIQMPGGIPVGTTPIDKGVEVLHFLSNLKKSKKINLVNLCNKDSSKNSVNKICEKFNEIAKNFKEIEFTRTETLNEECFNLLLTDTKKDKQTPKNSVYVPVLSDEELKQENSILQFSEIIDSGIFFGANNIRNATLFLIQVISQMNKELNLSDVLSAYKKGELK